jgi:hypothetical protein
MKAQAGLALLIVFVLGRFAGAVEPSFLERFALSENRAEVLKELVPGTEDYYYFHCLYYQQIGNFAEADKLLTTWIERYSQTQRVVEIRNRQALLRYSTEPEKTLQYLKSTLGLSFEQQRQVPGETPDLPTKLDPSLIARDVLTKRALDDQRYRDTIQGFNRHAFDWLLSLELGENRRRALLQSLELPDYPNLPALIVKDLETRNNTGFGSMPIHTNLTLEQLDELLKLKPDLLGSDAFIAAYIHRLHPSADSPNWLLDPALRQEYLDRLQKFADTLEPAQNSLKALVLYRRLEHDMGQGVYDKQRFGKYLQLPRAFDYVNPTYLEKADPMTRIHEVESNVVAATGFAPLSVDEELVRKYLQHFFEAGSTVDEFKKYVREDYLRRLYAETMLLQGTGDLEQWYSWLDPSAVDALKNRVDVEFVSENKQRFSSDEEVSLELNIKNVDRLLVKTFMIDAENYYRQFNRNVNTDIDLDGLMPNDEDVFTYTETPLHRVKRAFKFPELKGRGVWVIEFVGNGKSSRTVVQKGRLQYLSRTGTAGQMITVLDEKGQKLPDASVWFSGRTYTADKAGEIAVPFSTDPGEKPIVLVHGGFAGLDTLRHEAEAYKLIAGFHLDTESIRSGRTAQVAVRPLMYLNTTQVPVALVKNPVLTVTSMTSDGIVSTQQIRDFALHNDQLSIHSFRVPENLAQIQFALDGYIEPLTGSAPQPLHAEQLFPVNGINLTQNTATPLLTRFEGEYVLEILDKTGLPVADRPVHVRLNHIDFVDPIDVELKTDAAGRVALGPLKDIINVAALASPMPERSWDLTEPQFNYPNVIQGTVESGVRVPYSSTSENGATLLEMRDGQYVKNWSSSLQVGNGFVAASDLPAGDYLLHLKSPDRRVYVRLTKGVVGPYFVSSPTRALEIDQATPIQIDAESSNTSVAIQIGGVTKFTRVHVVATRFKPDTQLFGKLNVIPTPDPAAKAVSDGFALYQSGREIGDEYRYILERRFATKYPGNMLERPSMLLNPWELQETTAEQKPAAPPAPPASAPAIMAKQLAELQKEEGGQGGGVAVAFSPSYDFLGGDAAVFYNLVPDANGLITIPLKDLYGRQYLQIVATDPFSTVSLTATLPELSIPAVDLSLVKALDPAKHFVEQKRIRVLDKGETLSVSKTGEAYVQTYDSIASVYGLFHTLNADSNMAEFEFITRWPDLTPEEKLTKFSKYESHELNFFLFAKDKAFFDQSVRPFIQNKADKTFIDSWLLEADLGAYLTPWRYGQLNAIEKILLGRRIADENKRTQDFVGSALEMIPPDPERFNSLFMTALYGGALGGVGGSNLQDAVVSGSIRVDGGFLSGNGALITDMSAPALAQAEPSDAASVSGRIRAVGRDSFGLGLGAAHPEAKTDTPSLSRAQTDAEKDEKSGGKRALEAEFVEQRQNLMLFDTSEDGLRRAAYAALYRAVEKTKEWVESNYYKLPIERQIPELVPINAFWADYAKWDSSKPFRSTHLAEATSNFAEMMFALAVLDLPFASSEHKFDNGDAQVVLTPAAPLVAFYKDIEAVEQTSAETPVMVSQNYFRPDDRYRFEGNQQFDKFVKDEFLIGVVYACQVTVTNPTSTPHQIELLHQIPQGAIPVGGGRYTKSERIALQPYNTAAIEYYFYFPKSGKFEHFPVHASEDGKLLAFAPPQAMNVVKAPSSVDTASWQYVSQQGTPDQVLEFLRTQNLNRIDLGQIAWRMRDAAFYRQTLALLEERRMFNMALWSFAVQHNDVSGMTAFLQHRNDFLSSCGPWLESALLSIDPVERKSYQHIEYAPLINPRAHDLDGKWSITNDQLAIQYASLMFILAHRPSLDQDDFMALTYYMLLQDRVDRAIESFKHVVPEKLSTQLQYDYIKAYLAFYQEDVKTASEIAARYASYPVDRWKKLFGDVQAQAAQVAGNAGSSAGDERMKQDQLAALAPRLDIEVKDNSVVLYYTNLKECKLSFYPIDVEMLFTRTPFAPAKSGVFAGVKPSSEQTVTFDAAKSQIEVPLPDGYAKAHVVIEAESAGISRTGIRYASTLVAQLIESYGQVQVANKADNAALSKAYVKVFAQLKSGETQFYKDGYTDLRGRFDYASSSTLNVADVSQFAILVLDEAHGAKVLTAGPPAR